MLSFWILVQFLLCRSHCNLNIVWCKSYCLIHICHLFWDIFHLKVSFVNLHVTSKILLIIYRIICTIISLVDFWQVFWHLTIDLWDLVLWSLKWVLLRKFVHSHGNLIGDNDPVSMYQTPWLVLCFHRSRPSTAVWIWHRGLILVVFGARITSGSAISCRDYRLWLPRTVPTDRRLYRVTPGHRRSP